MKSVTVLGWWQQWFNSTRPRIFVWYFLLTAFSSVASILATHHILYERIYEESRESTSYQIKKFRRIASEEVVDSTLPPAEQAAAIFDAFLYKYKPADLDDYAITLLQGQVYRHTSLFPTELLSQDTALIQHWGQLNSAENKRVNTSIGKLLYVAEPIKIAEQTQGVLVIVHHTESIYQVIDGAVLLIIPAMLGVMIIAAAIAWVTAGRVLSPLRLLTQTAHSITESDMTQRIAVQGTDEIAKLTATFNEMLDRLQVAFESQQEFLKDASHELRTPITIIRGYLETLEYRPERRQQTIALAVDELERMSRLVNDLLLLAKAERPDFLDLKLEELDWLTEELYLKVRSLANRQWTLESKGLSPIRVDRQRITQAVMNLVQNSIRHTQEDDTIALGSSLRGDRACIWVRDTGEGIAPEDQLRIFERFARATTRTSQQGENYGLGLAIVEAIARAHGGWVELSSSPGKGATFTMVIPLDAIPDRDIHESDSDYRRQSPHYRLLGVWTSSPRLHDHRR